MAVFCNTARDPSDDRGGAGGVATGGDSVGANLCQILGEDRDLGPLPQMPDPTPNRDRPCTMTGVAKESRQDVQHDALPALLISITS